MKISPEMHRQLYPLAETDAETTEIQRIIDVVQPRAASFNFAVLTPPKDELAERRAKKADQISPSLGGVSVATEHKVDAA